ncbi:polysaccharide deacetylase [[Bacillus] enclensis]|jgi:peptidoglycan-N-acetylglucosamine deacetylase|uniref:Polysaccharide deacetylase family sporulation protein PdaB n=2 Tax=Rossellomorea TaxID=2837508 RepID=A0A0V8H369_9BACI|nr:polysaccharide deacetylase family sporulation protein PdaB [[Bacillus] enclensis]OAT84855.1 polysaccharide deacetylase family sporulation protein PdaB [Bacillus sp. MKU004]QTC40911.1 polysaccharide deacetylase family sporulation protein PdaB [Bacillus sp. V3]QWC23017.1 polysaccharide deacetylase family sporulation protein PdaB [Bacillus haikouensis]KSU56934.1 polysaccharide deacetylase [[Bacillus] enclensis]MBH9968179.1 polysaccharide deacetylase family sporulation protein PdaB [[Bacillus] 
MNVFYTVNAKRMKQISLVIIISFFTALFVYSGTLSSVPVFGTKDGPKAIYKGEKGVALTFNVGWGDEKAKPILDELKKLKVQSATFFLSGSWAERHPDLVEEIVKAGYEIGNLGYAYSDYTDMEPQKIRQDITKADDVFEKLNVKDVKLLRVPTGHFNKETLKVADSLGLTVVHWSVDSKDWTNPGTEEIINNVKDAKKGDIILLHASDSAKQTKNALPAIVKTLRGKGSFVSVSDMISNGDAKSSLIQ